MEIVKIKKETQQKVFEYLQSRPWREVNNLIAEMVNGDRELNPKVEVKEESKAK